MKKQILCTLFVLTIIIVGVAAYLVSQQTGDNSAAGSAAFGDGHYLGTLDAKNGRMPHAAVGRWWIDSDRRLFIQGYKAAYEQTTSQLHQKSGVDLNTLTAYRDGLDLGKRDAEQRRSEHAGTARWPQLQDKELFAFGYHEAYLDETAQLNAAEQTVRASLVP